jgi:hypothetical protein
MRRRLHGFHLRRRADVSQIGELVAGILERDKNIYLCTNGMFIRKRIQEFRPDRRFFFNVHLTGWKRIMICRRRRECSRAIEGIQVPSRFHGVPTPPSTKKPT